MRVPDPKANTTTEAYLAYKAGYLEESELKPKLYKPDWHFDGWLAYWAGLVNTYPTKENGDPEMLCDEEALVAYLSGVTDTYPEKIKDPYDVRIVGYLKHLASIRWPEPDYPVNNEEFYLSTMEPTHTSNSEPSADMELDTAEGKIISVEAYGDTSQQIYSGYNLIDLVPITNMQISAYQQCTTEVVMDSTLNRNVLHIIGDNNYPSVVFDLPRRLESGKYYALKFTYRSAEEYTQQNTMWFAPNWSANDWDVLGSLNAGRCKSGDGDTTNSVPQSAIWKTTSRRFYVDPAQYSSTQYCYNKICFSLGYNSYQSQLQGKEVWLADAEVYEITEDEWNADSYTSKDYEPYTGGIPAPNPDYPQEIQTVTGEQAVEIHGKNLLNLNFTTGSSQGVTLVKNEDGIITATGTSLRTGSISISPASVGSLVLENGETYTQRFEVIDGELPEGVSVVPSFMNSDGNIRYNYFRNNSSVTTESEMTCNTYNFYWSAADINFNFSFRVWLEKNNDLSSEYSPYQSQSYPISLGSTELCKISDYQDYIYKGADGWYLHKEVGLNILNSSDSWYYNSTSGGFSKPFPSDRVTSSYLGLCTHAIVQPNALTWQGIGKCGWNTSNTFWIEDGGTVATSLADWKTWLDNNVVKIYYILATPTDTKITDATLVGQLEALAGADTYNGKTFIKVTANDPNLPVLLKVEAYKY